MRLHHLLHATAVIALICLASPAMAQFSAETPQSETSAQDATATYYDIGSAAPDTTDYDYSDPAAEIAGQDPASQPLSQRSVGDVAGSLLGQKNTQKAIQAERVVRVLTGHDDSAVSDADQPDDVVPVLRGIMGLINKKKASQ